MRVRGIEFELTDNRMGGGYGEEVGFYIFKIKNQVKLKAMDVFLYPCSMKGLTHVCVCICLYIM